MIKTQNLKYFGVFILCCFLLLLSGCNNVITLQEYNKAEELCKNANQSLSVVLIDQLRMKESPYYIKAYCDNNVIIYSTLK